MATYYVDPSVAGPGTGTEVDPFSSWSSVSWSAGNSYLQKRGTTFSGRVTVGASGTQASPIYVGAYGTGAKPKIVGGSSDTAAIRVAQRSWVTFEDLDVSCPTTSSSGNGLEGFFTSSTEGIGITVRRCDFHDCKNIGLVLFTTVVGAGANVRAALVEDCTFTDNGYHGSHVYGAVQGAKFVNCVYARNAKTLAGHGASSFAHRNTYTNTGWTLVGGTTYSRTVSAPSGTTGTPSDVYQVMYNKSPYWHLTKNTATPTTPGLGEFGFSAGTLYVNVGEAPASGREVKASVEIATGIQYFYCRFLNTVDASGAEGAGSQADDFSTVEWIGCEADGNGGAGLFVNLGEDCAAYGCVLTDNTDAGVTSAAAIRNRFNNNTVLRNPIGINFTAGSDSSSARNNILSGNTTGLFVDADSAGMSINYNNTFANTTNYSGTSAGGNDVTSDPSLRSDYMPLSTAVRTAGTYLGGLDFYGKEFQSPPSIGAVQYQPARSVTTRTVVSRRRVR